MYYSLKKGVYYHCAEDYGYIANIYNGKQLTLDSVGADFLKELSEEPRSLEIIVDNLTKKYDAAREELTNDFMEIASILQAEGYITISLSPNVETILEDHTRDIVIPPIIDLTIEITNKCNERCIHCYLADAKKDDGVVMDLDTVKRLIDEFAQIGGERVTFTGGEAFLHKDLMVAIEYATSKGLCIAIFSNLIATSPSQVERLKDCNLIGIQVSLYSTDPKTHDTITKVKGSCYRTLASIENMVNANLPIKIVCPVMRVNKDSVLNVVDYAKKLNVAIELEMYINSREDQSDDNLQHRLSIEEMSAFMNDLMDYDPKMGVNILHRHKQDYNQTYNFVEELNSPLCQAGYYGLYITATGKIAICPNMQGYVLGDITSDSLQSIWNQNQKLQEIRSLYLVDFKKCVQCEARDYCIRCYAHNYAEAKDIKTMPRYACEMAFATKRVIESHLSLQQNI